MVPLVSVDLEVSKLRQVVVVDSMAAEEEALGVEVEEAPVIAPTACPVISLPVCTLETVTLNFTIKFTYYLN